MQGLDIRATHVRGRSWLHRLDPVPKLAWIGVVVVVAFATYDPVPLAAIAVAGYLAGVSAGLGRPLARVLIALAPIAASIVVIQTIAPAACGTSCTPVAQVGPLTLYGEGMTRGLSLAARIVAMEVVALGALMATHPSDLFAALARLRVPYLATFMIAMTLQLVPALQRELGIVLAAQRARGLRASGLGAVLPAFVPVFVGAFERVGRTAISLESRGFGGGPRTSYRRVRFRRVDLVVTALALPAVLAGAWLGLTRWSAAATGMLPLSAAAVEVIFLAAATIFLVVIGRAVAAIGRA